MIRFWDFIAPRCRRAGELSRSAREGIAVAVKCHYCEREASYHITLIGGGAARTVDVCSEHAQRPELREGVRPPPECPRCGVRMNSGTAWKPSDKPEDRGAEWIRSFRHCPGCGYTVEGE